MSEEDKCDDYDRKYRVNNAQQKQINSSIVSNINLQEKDSSVVVGDIEASVDTTNVILLQEKKRKLQEIDSIHGYQLEDNSPANNRLSNYFYEQVSGESDAQSGKIPRKMVNSNSKILDYNVDPYDFADEELIEFSLEIFQYYDLFQLFQITESSARNFLSSVRQMYNPDNSFHNFKHVYNVLHTAFHILKNGADKFLLPLDILAIFVSAICHDLGHPGNNNAFEEATGSELFKLYSPDKVVLERHHASLTHTLLQSSDADHNILLNMNQEQKGHFYYQVGVIIMATDMGKHGQIVKDAQHYARNVKFDSSDSDSSSTEQNFLQNDHYSEYHRESNEKRSRSGSLSLLKNEFDPKNPEVRLLLTRIIVHSADIGAQTLCTPLAYKWCDRCYEEFCSQANKEKLLGIKTSEFIHEVKEESKKYATQYSFINDIVEPLWKALSELLPELAFAYQQLGINKTSYGKKFK